MCRLRINLFSSIMRQEVAFFDVNRTGELTNRLSEDVRTTRADQGRPTADYSLHLTCIALNAPLQRSVGCLQREGHVPPPTTCMAGMLSQWYRTSWFHAPSTRTALNGTKVDRASKACMAMVQRAELGCRLTA